MAYHLASFVPAEQVEELLRAEFERGWQAAIEAASKSALDWQNHHGRYGWEISEVIQSIADAIRALKPPEQS